MGHVTMISRQEMNGTNFTPKFKIILLGDAGVGKTSFFLRIRDEEFHVDPLSSIGVDSCTKCVKADNREVQISLWDTAGVERFRTLTRNFYRNAHAVFLMFSVDDPSTLFYLSKWEQDALEYAPTALRFLIGNKADLEMIVSKASMEAFATSHNCESAFLTSAKTGEGVSSVLKSVAETLSAYHKKTTYDQENSWLEHSAHVNLGNPNTKKKSTCC